MAADGEAQGSTVLLSYFVGAWAILAAFAFLAAVISGIGLGVRRLFGLRSVDVDDRFLAFWVGYGIVIALLLAWNFFLAIDGRALALVVVLGMVGAFAARREFRHACAGIEWRHEKKLAVLGALASLWLANLCTGPFTSWDGALYHLQAVRWAASHPVVPGIANLHAPLAFNNSNFLYAAMLDSGPWPFRAFHVSIGLLIWVLLLQSLSHAARFVAGRTRRGVHLFGMLLLAPALYSALDGRAASYETDLPTALVLLAAGLHLYTLLVGDREDPRERAYSVVALSVLLATAVCLKISAGIFVAGAWLLALIVWWRTGPRAARTLRKTLCWSVTIVVVWAALWMGHGVVMSGYPLFPTPLAGMPVEWRAPREHAAAELANIAFTEREFSWTIGRNWLRLVLREDPYSIFVPSCIAAITLVLAWWLARRRAPPAGSCAAWLLWPLAVALTAWLVVAPSTRYGWPLFWILASLGACLAFVLLSDATQQRVAPALLVAATCLGISPAVVTPLTLASARKEDPWHALRTANFILPPPGRLFHPVAEVPKLTDYTTASGFVVQVPAKDGDRDHLGKCWDSPLPCTSNPAKNLRLRRPGDIERGFVVDGEWQMEDWPYYWRKDFLPAWRIRMGHQ